MYTPARVAPRNGSKVAKGDKNRERERKLSEQDILEGAAHLIRVRGVDALSMRGLARKLGVSPMAIYYYVPSKEVLLNRVAESLLSSLPTPTPSPDAWERQMRDYAMSVWELLSIHPGLSRSVLERPPIKASRRLSQYAFSLLAAGGFDEMTALRCLFGFHTYLAGVLSVEAQLERPSTRKAEARWRKRLSPEELRVASQFDQFDARSRMEFGLETLLAGIRSRRPQKLSS